MNKISVVDGNIKTNFIDKTVFCEFIPKKDEFLVDILKLKIQEDTDLEINILESSKLDIFINVLKDVKVNICEYINSSDIKIEYKYYLEENSTVEIKKINNSNRVKEYDIVNLNGENASFKRVLKTISKDSEKYDILVYHNAKNTKSDLINHGVNIDDGSLTFNVSTFVPENISGCFANQTNRIINLTNNKCQINPNMYIDCFDVVANHSAFIGTFKESELFYLQSRGIPKVEATKLLIKGFLNSDLTEKQKEKYESVLNEYWG